MQVSRTRSVAIDPWAIPQGLGPGRVGIRSRSPRFRSIFLHNQVRIHPTGPKGADTRPPRQAGPSLPRRGLGLHPHRGLVKGNMGIRIGGIQRGSQLAMAHLEQHFGESRNTRRRLQVANVGLQRPDRAVGLVMGPEGFG